MRGLMKMRTNEAKPAPMGHGLSNYPTPQMARGALFWGGR
jgi:hypothetical protein